MRIQQVRMVETLSRLVQIGSVNPDLAPGGQGEHDVAVFLQEVLRASGVDCRVETIAPGRSNIIATLNGSANGPHLALNAHLDTVSVEGMADPFSGRIEDGRVYGRGSLDCKAGVAIAVEVLLTLRHAAESFGGALTFCGVIDEEHASLGSRAFLEDVTPDACLILEPTNLDVVVGCGGFLWAEIEARGRAVHGSLYEDGIDAIEHMGRIQTQLAALRTRLLAGAPYSHPLAANGSAMLPSVHCSLIRGGTDLATYPDQCVMGIERRMVYGESFEQVHRELDEILGGAKSECGELDAEVRVLLERSPWESPAGRLLYVIERAASKHNHSPERVSVRGWTDAAYFGAAGVDTILFGPSGEGAHAKAEYVEIASMVSCAEIVAEAAMSYLNGA